MSGENAKFRKPIWVNFLVVTLLLITTGFTLTACVHIKPKGESTKPASQSTKQEKKNKLAKSTSLKDKTQGHDEAQDTTDDDDPE